MPDGGKKKTRQRVSLSQRLVNVVDRLGNSAATDPRRQPQSLCGSITTWVFMAIALYMFVATVRKYVIHEYGESVGGRAQMNGLYQYRDGADDAPKNHTWGDYHVPSLELKITSKLIFFHKEDERPALFKVEARDRSGYLRTRRSDARETPVAFAVHNTHQVPINSFDQRVNAKAQSRGSGVKSNLRDRMFYSNAVRGAESLAVLRAINAGTLDQEHEQFQEHTARLIVRFDREQLQRLKPCQLNLLLYNEGQFDAMWTRGFQAAPFNKSDLPAQASDTVTWLRKRFRDKGGGIKLPISLVQLEVTLTRETLVAFITAQSESAQVGKQAVKDAIEDAMVQGGKFVDWSYVVNYVNNFNTTIEEAACDGAAALNTERLSGLPFAYLSSDALLLPLALAWPLEPFNVLIGGQGTVERVTVTKVDTFDTPLNGSNGERLLQRLTLVRKAGDALHGRAIATDPSALATDPTTEAGAGWVCPVGWYGDGECNCECGGVDIDCVCPTCSSVAETGCESAGALGPFCSPRGRCSEKQSSGTLRVSDGCAAGTLRLPGETVLVGLQGDSSDNRPGECPACPGDKIFGGVPQRVGPKEVFTCNPRAVASLNSDFNTGRGGGGLTTSAAFRAMPRQGITFPSPTADVAERDGGFEAEARIGAHWREKVVVVGAGAKSFGYQELMLAPGGGADGPTQKGPLGMKAASLFFTETGGVGDAANCSLGLVGLLVSPVSYASASIQVMLPRNVAEKYSLAFKQGYLFPPAVGASGREPYEVRLHGRTLTVREVSRITPVFWRAGAGGDGQGGGVDYVQTLFLRDPPRLKVGGRGTFKAPAAAGATEVSIRDTSLLRAGTQAFSTPCLPASENATAANATGCTLPMLHVLSGGDHWMGEVVGVAGNVVTLKYPLPFAVDQDTEFFTVHSPARPQEALTGCDSSEASFVYSVHTLTLLNTGEPYIPRDRYLPTSEEPQQSPDVLDIETALLVKVGSAPNKSEPLSLCPDKLSSEDPVPAPRFEMNGWDEWRLFREDSVGRCFSITDPDTVCASAREEAGRTGEDVCRDEMYPSEVHSFEHHVPVNNKWIPKFPIYDRNTIQDPEHLLDIVYDYHFYHDQSIREADSVFTAGRPSAGDVVFDQVENVSRVSFFAASLGYKSRANSKRFAADLSDLLPAGNPKLITKVTIQTAPYAPEDLVSVQNAGGATNWPWKDARKTQELIGRFAPLPIEFDISALGQQGGAIEGLTLQPGIEYKFDAQVSIQPHTEEDEISHKRYSKAWTSRVIRKRAFSTPLGADEPSHVARVRFTISFDPTAISSVRAIRYPFWSAASHAGSAMLFLALGLLFLTTAQRVLHFGAYLPSRGGRQPKRLVALDARIAEIKHE